MRLDDRQRRVKIIADALDDPDYEVIMIHSDTIGKVLTEPNPQVFLSRLAPVLRQRGIHTPPSLHTWRAVRKELNRRAAARLSNGRD